MKSECNVATTLIPSTCSTQCAVVQKLGLFILHKVGRFGNKARTACSRAPHSDKLVVFQRICLPMIWSDICWNFWCYMEARRTLWSATFFSSLVFYTASPKRCHAHQYSTQPHQNGAMPANILFTRCELTKCFAVLKRYIPRPSLPLKMVV